MINSPEEIRELRSSLLWIVDTVLEYSPRQSDLELHLEYLLAEPKGESRTLEVGILKRLTKVLAYDVLRKRDNMYKSFQRFDPKAITKLKRALIEEISQIGNDKSWNFYFEAVDKCIDKMQNHDENCTKIFTWLKF